MKNINILYISSALICLITTTVAVPDDPTKCDSGCTNAEKYCTTSSDCMYRDAKEYPCDDAFDCPVDYDCGNSTI